MGPYTLERAERNRYWLDRDRPGELEFIDSYANKTGGPILELASGAARVTKELARRGHTVYGVEMSRPMLDKAREVVGKMDQAIRDRIRLVQGDMTRFAFGRKFPLIVIPFYSFWHNFNEAGAQLCIQCMVSHLAPGGLFLVEGERRDRGFNEFWRSAGERFRFRFRYEQYAMENDVYEGPGSFLVGWNK